MNHLPCLWARFQYKVKGRFRSASKAREPAAGHNDFSQTCLPRLCAESGALPRQRYRNTYLSRCTVHHAADGIEIVLNAIVRERFDDHCRAIPFQCLTCVTRDSDRITHVVQAVEEGDQVKILTGITNGVRLVELNVADAGRRGSLTGGPDRGVVVVVAYKKGI